MELSSVERVLGHPESNPWLQRVAKAGYAIKGLVYAIMGVLALQVAFGAGGRLAGEHEAVEHVGRQPLGEAALVIIGGGLLGYALWRAIEGLIDVHRDGHSWKGIGGRIAALGSAIVNGAVGVAAIQLAAGASGASDHDPKRWGAGVTSSVVRGTP